MPLYKFLPTMFPFNSVEPGNVMPNNQLKMHYILREWQAESYQWEIEWPFQSFFLQITNIIESNTIRMEKCPYRVFLWCMREKTNRTEVAVKVQFLHFSFPNWSLFLEFFSYFQPFILLGPFFSEGYWRYLAQWLTSLVRTLVSAFLFLGDVARRRQMSYDVARLRLMAPMGLWRNSIPFFGAAALCTTKIDDFRASLTSPLR